MIRPLIRWWVRRQLGPYRAAFNSPDMTRPRQTQSEERILIVGGGVAGMLAATVLAERGFRVTLRRPLITLAANWGVAEGASREAKQQRSSMVSMRSFAEKAQGGGKTIDRYQILTLDGQDIRSTTKRRRPSSICWSRSRGSFVARMYSRRRLATRWASLSMTLR